MKKPLGLGLGLGLGLVGLHATGFGQALDTSINTAATRAKPPAEISADTTVFSREQMHLPNDVAGIPVTYDFKEMRTRYRYRIEYSSPSDYRYNQQNWSEVDTYQLAYDDLNYNRQHFNTLYFRFADSPMPVGRAVDFHSFGLARRQCLWDHLEIADALLSDPEIRRFLVEINNVNKIEIAFVDNSQKAVADYTLKREFRVYDDPILRVGIVLNSEKKCFPDSKDPSADPKAAYLELIKQSFLAQLEQYQQTQAKTAEVKAKNELTQEQLKVDGERAKKLLDSIGGKLKK